MHPTIFLGLLGLSNAVPTEVVEKRSALEPYAPYTVSCPNNLLRQATRLNPDEKRYIDSRRPLANTALAKWINKVWDTFIEDCRIPTLALALSGGGPKAALLTAGVMYGSDDRDSQGPTAGLLQSMTYISGLSGGSLTVAGVMVNDFSKVSTLKKTLYDQIDQDPFALALANSEAIVGVSTTISSKSADGLQSQDVSNKTLAGYPATLVDTYGRAIAYDFIGGPDGAAGLTWSNVTTQPSFQSHQAPFPIIALADVDLTTGSCLPTPPGPVWEASPVEFGAWDPAVKQFIPTRYWGTTLTNGKPNTRNTCTAGFDNAGFIAAISSNILPTSGDNCTVPTNMSATPALSQLAQLIDSAQGNAQDIITPYAIIPNPFYRSSRAGSSSKNPFLYMIDGGNVGSAVPVLPFVQKARDVDVIFAIDVESQVNNVTDGTSMYNSYTAAQGLGLTKMPAVPDANTYAAQNIGSQARFYGCYDTKLTTVIFIPDGNTSITSSETFNFTPALIDLVFNQGTDMITQGNDTQWPACVACGIMHKTLQKLPEVCTQCLEKYCWSPKTTCAKRS